MEKLWKTEQAHVSEEDEDYETGDKGTDALMLLFDVREKMWKKDKNGQIFLHNCLQLAIKLIKNKIIATDKSLIGITFFGTKKIKSTNGLDDVYEFQELSQPSAKHITKLRKLLEESDAFDKDYGMLSNNESVSISNALWHCGITFSKAKLKKRDMQRIWMFTNDDNPNSGNTYERDRIIQQTKDHEELGRLISLFYSSVSEQKFDFNKFYNSIFSTYEEDAEDPSYQNAFVLDESNEFFEACLRKQFRKRRLTTLALHLSRDVSIGMEVFALLVTQRKNTPIQLEASTNFPLKVDSRHICEDTGVYIELDKIKRYIECGGKRIYFDQDDLIGLRYTDTPGIKLLHFQSISDLRLWDNIRSPYFLFPSEDYIDGSEKAFIALHTSMMKKKVMAICQLVLRRNSSPQIVALIPQEEEYDAMGQTQSTGFCMVFLPYLDDIRSLRLHQMRKANNNQIDAAKQIIKKLTISEVPSFENPVLQKHYASIQAIALDEDELEFDESNDSTLPDSEGLLNETIQQAIREFRKLCGGDEINKTDTKRKSKNLPGPTPRKKVKKEVSMESNECHKTEYWKALLEQDKLSTQTVSNMKEFLNAHSQSANGRKAQLIERIAQFLQEN